MNKTKEKQIEKTTSNVKVWESFKDEYETRVHHLFDKKDN